MARSTDAARAGVAAGSGPAGLHALKLEARSPRRRIALVCDPRFSGGTSSAVAAEIKALGGFFDLSVVALETAMFKGRAVHPAIAAALENLGLEMLWNPAVVRAEVIVIHNPSCLRFDTGLATRLSCDAAFVVTHENFLRPGGAEGFDVAGCLGRIRSALICGRRVLAPVSGINRRTVEDWLGRNGGGWEIAAADWFNILDLEAMPPNPRPRDRRGRHSRPGLEKFPPLAAMRAHFPPHAERCEILGADGLLLESADVPAHWELRRFGSMEVARFLARIDFFVYFTHPNWRDSFGRVVAEAVAAGKLAITDPATAATFGAGVVASDGADVDRIVRAFVADPGRYAAEVRAAQTGLARFGARAFRARLRALLGPADRGAARHALV